MAENYKKLYEAQKAEHEKTWTKFRRAQKDIMMVEGNYAGAMADNAELVAVMRKHCLAMLQFLDLNYPRNDLPSKGT